nr:hypothetical protein GCM10025730_37220 [Promicromonospora thailandica]
MAWMRGSTSASASAQSGAMTCDNGDGVGASAASAGGVGFTVVSTSRRLPGATDTDSLCQPSHACPTE